MSDTVYHSQARGVHPASFVQAAEPDTTALQDGTEWTDTSEGPPYVRKVWRAGSARWDAVQMDATGYPLPHLHRLEEYVLNQTPNPPDAPVLGTTPASPPGASPWPAGTYTLGYTYVATDGETAPSPTAAVTVDGTQWITFRTGPPPSDIGPNFLGIVTVYVMDPLPPGAVGVYTGYVDGPPVDTLANIPNNTDPGASQPPPENQTGTWLVRVVDSHATALLDLPLPTLGTAPATLVGQDPATLLPAFCPAPDPIVATALLQQATEQPSPSATTCTQVRCGAATALRDHLNDWYQNVRNILNAAIYQLGMTLGGLLVDTGTAFFVALTDGIDIELAPEVYNLLKLVLRAVPGITGAVLQAGFALLSTSQLEWLRTKVYCHITCSANQITLTQDQLFAWHDDIAADTTILSGIQRDVCAAIVAWGANWSLSAWAQQAQTGAGLPTHECDAYVCP